VGICIGAGIVISILSLITVAYWGELSSCEIITVYVYVYKLTYITCVCVYLCIHIYIHTYVCIHVCIRRRIVISILSLITVAYWGELSSCEIITVCVYVYKLTYVTCVYVYIYVYIYTYKKKCMYSCMYT
jgi:hypothetical protein